MPTIPNRQTNLRQRHTTLIPASIGVLLLLFVSLDSHVQSAPPMAVATIPSPIATVPTPVPTSGSTPFWTTWGARQYDLADDGGALWIGTTGGVIRWDKSAKTHRRYTTVDGFPHQTVFAVAVDRTGNRWFGGDGGLSRLDANDQWQHFTTANSGLYTNTVDAIAITSDGTLYVNHGLPNGGVSRLDRTGVWQPFPNRTAAIESDYAHILQTTNRNRLWTVAGADIWLDYAVYNGVSLQDRTPAGATMPPLAMAADSQQRVWTIINDGEVGVWQNGAWSTSWVNLFNFGGYLSALTVDNQDNVWIGWVARDFAYSSYSAGISVLDEKYGLDSGVPNQVTHMLATAEGLWATGPGWLRQPDGVVTRFQDSPLYPKVTDALVAADGTVWFSSGYHVSGTAGAVQRYNDQQTLSLADDQWEILNGDASGWVDTFEEAPNGDVWYTTSCTTRMGWYGCLALIQYHAGQKYIYTVMDYPTDDHFSFGGVTADLYFQDDRHLWLGMVQSGPEQAGVSHIDLGDDPLDPSDDLRTNYPIGSVRSIVLDAASRLWVTNGSGLFRYDGSTWETIYQGEYIHDLVMATDGTLFARLGPTPQACQLFLCLAPVSSVVVLVVRPDGTLERYDQIATVVANEAARVRSATRRNSLWVIGVDGAIWYRYADAGVHELRRYVDADNITSYPIPVAADAVQRVEIDHLNRIWLVANNQLWRFASAASVPVITATPTTTSTPTATPSTPTAAPTSTPVGVPTLPFYFDVEVIVSVPKREILVGETITVLVTIENQSIGCQYPVYDLTLFQEDNSLFDYLSPMKVGPPVAAQTIYTLTATTPGTTHLWASAYGERNCYDYWAWQYINGSSAPLLVVGDSSMPTPTASPTAPNTVTPTLTGTATATATPVPLSTLSPTPTLTATASPIPLVATAQPGDGNGDQQINVDDLTACMQEIFDGDGLFWLDAPSGSYGGTSGCDANQDTRIDAGDLSCTVRLLFAGSDACTSSALVQRAETVQTRGNALAIAPNLTATVGGQVQVPIHLTTTESDITAVAFSLHYNPDHFSFNSADENQDGLPDARAFQVATTLGRATSTVTTAPGVINIALVAVADDPKPFTDGAFVTLTFQVKELGEVNGIVSPISFSGAVPASLGSVKGQSVPVTVQDGAVQIAPLLAPFRLYLPFMDK